MDSRLYKVDGRRLLSLTKTDCPIFALALVAYERGRCHVEHQFFRNVDSYHFWSDDGRIEFRVRADDWQKIEPYLRSGAWNPEFAPVPTIGFLHPERAFDIPDLPENDKTLYLRILDALEKEFPRDYPTSPF